MRSKKLLNYENGLLMMLFFGMGFVFLDRLAINYLFPFIEEDFGLSNTEIGILGAAASISWAISGPIFSYMADKGGKRKKIIILSMILFSIISFTQGLAIGFISLLILRLLIGLFEGPFLPIAQSVMSIESTPSRRGFNMGFIQVTPTGLFGGLLAPLILVAIANAFNWKVAFFFTIIPGLILSIVMAKYLKEPYTNAEPQNSELKKSEITYENDAKLIDVIKNRNVLLSIIICAFALTWFNVFAIYAPLFIVNVKGFSTGSMSVIMSVAGAAAMIWGFVVPAISDKLGRKLIMTIAAVISAISPLLILYSQATLITLIILIFLTHTGQGFHPLFMSIIPSESVSPKYIGLTIGAIMGFGEIIGGVLSPIFAGFFADTINIYAPLWICSISAIGAAFVSMFIKETAPAKLKKNKYNKKIVDL